MPTNIQTIKNFPALIKCLHAKTLVEARKEIEKFINKNYLRPRQSPVGHNPVLKAWMELN